MGRRISQLPDGTIANARSAPTSTASATGSTASTATASSVAPTTSSTESTAAATPPTTSARTSAAGAAALWLRAVGGSEATAAAPFAGHPGSELRELSQRGQRGRAVRGGAFQGSWRSFSPVPRFLFSSALNLMITPRNKADKLCDTK